jgi:DNA-directed RNA polymerase specialized sigma24 family protein
MHGPSRLAATASSDLEQFLTAARPKLDSMLVSQRVPPQDAGDVLQDALLTFLVKDTKAVANPEAWLLGILRRKILLYWRVKTRQRRLRMLLAQTLSTSEPPSQERQLVIRELVALTAHLPPRTIMVLWLRCGLAHKPREVARILRCRPDSVRKLTRRALERARLHLDAAGRRPRPGPIAPPPGASCHAASTPGPAAARGPAAPDTDQPLALVAAQPPPPARRHRSGSGTPRAPRR